MTAGSLPVGSDVTSFFLADELALLVAERQPLLDPYQHPQLCPDLGALPFAQSCHRGSVTIECLPVGSFVCSYACAVRVAELLTLRVAERQPLFSAKQLSKLRTVFGALSKVQAVT